MNVFNSEGITFVGGLGRDCPSADGQQSSLGFVLVWFSVPILECLFLFVGLCTSLGAFKG